MFVFANKSCILSLLFLISCNQTESTKNISNIKEEIDEINQLIEENARKSNTIRDFKKSSEDTDGPYSADDSSFNPTGKFYFLTVDPTKKDSIWLTFSAETEQDILKKYPKLTVFKIRPASISSDNWLKIRQNCLRQNLIFDISDEPTGWLLENGVYLK